MDKFPSSEDIQRELAAIEKQIEHLRERKSLLLKYRKLAAEIASSQKAASIRDHDDQSIVTQNARPKTSHVLAERILSDIGPLPTHTILQKLRERGWKGSGDERRDWDRVNKMLQRHDDIFERHGRGVWRIKA